MTTKICIISGDIFSLLFTLMPAMLLLLRLRENLLALSHYEYKHLQKLTLHTNITLLKTLIAYDMFIYIIKSVSFADKLFFD